MLLPRHFSDRYLTGDLEDRGTNHFRVSSRSKKNAPFEENVPDVVPKTGLEPVHPCGR